MVSFASAVSLNGIAEVSSSTNTSHDSSIQITFNLTNEGVAGDLNWSYSNFTSSQTGLTFSFDDSYMADGSSTAVTELITATITFDEHQTGTITGNIGVGNDDAGVDESLAFSVTILDSKELAVSSATIAEGANSTTITITNEGNVDLTGITLTSTGDFDVNFSNNDFALAKGIDTTITVTSLDDLYDLLGSEPSITITATADDVDNTTATGAITTVPSFCEDCENPGNLKIEITDISTVRGFGDDENYWYPFDVVEAEIEIENDGSWDIQDVELSWALYTTDGKKITDDTESDFNLDEDDDRTITLTFTLDEDVDDMEGEDLILYVKAQGKVDDKDSAYDDEDTCVWASEEVEVVSDDKFIVLDDFEFNGVAIQNLKLDTEIPCGTELQIVADIWNIGDDKEEDITILIKSNELGISKKVTIDDINNFDNEKLETTVTIPEDVEAGEYTISFMIYDEDNDLFETDEEEDKAIFNVIINVAGNCKIEYSGSITAALTSEANAGEEVTVKTTIKNTEDKTITYVLNVKDYDEWATLNALDSNSITLVAGESRDVTLTFNVNKGVSGDKVFRIDLLSENGLIVSTQPVSISVTPQKSLISGIKLPENNLYLWGIGALNVLLILAIIVVAVRLSRE